MSLSRAAQVRCVSVGKTRGYKDSSTGSPNQSLKGMFEKHHNYLADTSTLYTADV